MVEVDPTKHPLALLQPYDSVHQPLPFCLCHIQAKWKGGASKRSTSEWEAQMCSILLLNLHVLVGGFKLTLQAYIPFLKNWTKS